MTEKLETKLICLWLEIAKEQRQNEIKRGLGKEGTLSFERLGCYKCKGDYYDCSNYVGKIVQYK